MMGLELGMTLGRKDCKLFDLEKPMVGDALSSKNTIMNSKRRAGIHHEVAR